MIQKDIGLVHIGRLCLRSDNVFDLGKKIGTGANRVGPVALRLREWPCYFLGGELTTPDHPDIE